MVICFKNYDSQMEEIKATGYESSKEKAFPLFLLIKIYLKVPLNEMVWALKVVI